MKLTTNKIQQVTYVSHYLSLQAEDLVELEIQLSKHMSCSLCLNQYKVIRWTQEVHEMIGIGYLLKGYSNLR